jgi:hypothetical protein
MQSQEDAFNELSFYTLSHPVRDYFIHQHVVDAFHAQTAHKNSKPIELLFSLIGLYLYLKKDYTGRQVQNAHTKLAQSKKNCPEIIFPTQSGVITVTDVLRSQPGMERDHMIREWCISVWTAYRNSHSTIETFVKGNLEV